MFYCTCNLKNSCNNKTTWSRNPSCSFEVKEAPEGSCLIIDIEQPRKQNHPIGFVVLKGGEPCPESPQMAAERVVGGRPWHQNTFIYEGIGVGTYTITAQTFAAKSLGKFCIRFRSACATVEPISSNGGNWADNRFHTL